MFKLMVCREITKLMSRRLDAPLGFKNRLLLRMHVGMCGACHECNKQFELLHQAGNAYKPLAGEQDATDEDPTRSNR
ncbi:zf-HC2 domain-containing protein [Halomonas sp. PR-M31]|uniref:zf-HC2 domain-containing protein n=1 Tax=Halomonas sp. PR-M31 TaxID=1471202 RepID=UPI00069F3362|nr:zf-HC2 domain-containing protein [Halomonas sp. PR-M31]